MNDSRKKQEDRKNRYSKNIDFDKNKQEGLKKRRKKIKQSDIR